MEKYDRILTAIKENTPLLQMIESGISPEAIKEVVIESLEPYFENKDILNKFAIDALVVESINLFKLKNDSWFFERFEKCLSTYRLAKSKNPNTCFESCAFWQNDIKQSISKFWSVLHLEVDKTTLGGEEYLHECLRNIGDIIEGLTKPYLKILLHQVYIGNGINVNSDYINSLDLGNIIDELIKKSNCPNLFILPPAKVRLNQWRNIAYHHSAKIEKNEVICWYGKSPNLTYFQLPKDELLDIVWIVSKIFRLLTLADTLFIIDNVNEINKFLPPCEVRDEAEFIVFATGLASQGFEIVDFDKNYDKAFLVIRDVSNISPYKRLSHVSQFIYLLWDFTHSNQLVIEYFDNNNIPRFRLSSDSKLCEKIYNGELEYSILPKTMEIIDLKKGKKLKLYVKT